MTTKSLFGPIMMGLGIGLAASAYAAKLSGKFEVCVQDDDGQPMAGVYVRCEFENPPTDWSEKRSDECYLKKTDARGHCTFKGRTSTGSVVCTAVDRGFYRTCSDIPIKEVTKEHVLIPEYQVTTIVVQRVKRPIPLFVKAVECARGHGFGPGTNTVSFDMIKADWLPPRGTGEVADVRVTRMPRKSFGIVEPDDYRKGESYEDVLRIEFPGEGNGIQEVEPLEGCDLMVRRAPEDGYKLSWEERKGKDRKLNRYSTESMTRCHCIRIRTQTDASGNVIAGYYGKIYGGFDFGGNLHEDANVAIDWFRYTYFLNLTPCERNLEFNETNLNNETSDAIWHYL